MTEKSLDKMLKDFHNQARDNVKAYKDKAYHGAKKDRELKQQKKRWSKL